MTNLETAGEIFQKFLNYRDNFTRSLTKPSLVRAESPQNKTMDAGGELSARDGGWLIRVFGFPRTALSSTVALHCQQMYRLRRPGFTLTARIKRILTESD